jgi:hypothetical protein
MTNYLEDSFGLYLVFFKSDENHKTFLIDTSIAWRESYSLSERIRELDRDFSLKFSPKLLLKMNVDNLPSSKQFEFSNNFFDEIRDFRVMHNIYFIDEELLREKISSFFSKNTPNYISIWGDWEMIIKV